MPRPEASSALTPRLYELDALRGVAACVVVLHHLRSIFNDEPPRWFLRPFTDGRAAVVLFFTLSGFVLSLAYWSGRSLPYKQFLIRRIFRIYVPYAIACGFTIAVAAHLLYATLPLSPWFYETWHTALTPQLIAAQFLTMQTGPEINTAFWSLRYEMEMSILFPALCGLIHWLQPKRSVALGATLAVSGFFLFKHPLSASLAELGRTIMWSSCFIFGAVLAWKRERISLIYSATSTPLRTIVLVFALLGYYSRKDLLMIPSSCVLIVFAQQGLIKNWLRRPLPGYLGSISYSLYLVHGTVLFALVILLYGRVSLGVLIALFLATTFLLAHLFRIGIEVPADQAGKYLARKIQVTTVTKST